MSSILGRVRFSVKEKLCKQLRRFRNAGVRVRYLIVINLLNGRSARTTAGVLGVHNTTVYRVAKRFQQDGEWGLLRLVEAGKLAGEPGARDFAVSWPLPSLGTSVTVDFRPARSETPFFGVRHSGEKARLFAPFRNGIAAPLTIGKSGPACGARP